jgi:hypothetical protein
MASLSPSKGILDIQLQTSRYIFPFARGTRKTMAYTLLKYIYQILFYAYMKILVFCFLVIFKNIYEMHRKNIKNNGQNIQYWNNNYVFEVINEHSSTSFLEHAAT